MCVDDYQFRHFSAQRSKVCRRFVIVNEDQFAKTYFVNISQFQQFGELALCRILIYLSTKGLIIQNKKFYLPKFNAIIQPYTFCRIIFQALDQKQILLKSYPSTKPSEDIFTENEDIEDEQYKKAPESEENYYCRFEEIDDAEEINYILQDSHNQPSPLIKETMAVVEDQNTGDERMVDEHEEKHSDEKYKKIKEAERGIRQVIIAVKIWRNLYQSKRCNLTKAAKVVGISKKSLDDYYLVLRVGEVLGFPFEENLEGMMGDLRNFIKAQEEKVTGKLGKNVDCFKLVQEIDLDKLLNQFQEKEGLMKQ